MATRRIGSIRPRGENVWQLVAEAPPDHRTGARRQRTRTFHGSRREAEKALQRFALEVAATVPQHDTATVDDLVTEYLAVAAADMSPGSAADFRWYYDTKASPTIGRLLVTKLEGHHLERLYADLRAHGGRCRLGPARKCTTYPCDHGGGSPLAASTVKRLHTILHAALEQACRWRWIARNPADDLRRSKRIAVKNRRPVTASASGVVQLTSWLSTHDVEMWAFVVLAARRGPRPGEVCALRWTDIDLEGERITFARNIARAPGQRPGWIEKDTKTGDERTIALRGVAKAAVEAHRALCVQRALALGTGLPADAFLFVHEGDQQKPWQPGNISRRLRRACTAAGAGPITFRALRHYVATTMVSNGVDPVTVAGTLGHSRPSTTMNIYADWVPTADEAAADLMDAELDAAAGDG